MTSRRYRVVDVFTREPYRGNPVAVVIDGDGPGDDAMQRFARWTNLSETTFVLAPTDAAADYRLRIFTPGGELPFAGHPTLGTCHAWLSAGGTPRDAGTIVQQCAVGHVRVRREGAHRLAFEAPQLRRSDPEAALVAQVLAALGADASRLRAAQWLDNGPQWLALRFDSAETVLALEPDHAALKPLAKIGVIGAHPQGAECAFEVRAFAAAIGIAEDPVTGSLNASLAQWLIGAGQAPARYVAAQGTRLGRAGRVYVAQDQNRIWVGGDSVTCVEGSVTL
ncbi:MAG: PhzF family phenazine biosynthesis protein [Rhizobacter sp.]|nr:PhzF family phenazine biosynthesis protein [Rhizobacter sp.]